MKRLVSGFLMLSLSGLMPTVFADGLLPPKNQTTQEAQVQSTVAQPTVQKITLDAGTRIPITIYNTVNSDNLKTGDMISVTVNEPVKIKGIVVFKKGSTGVLNVAKSVKSRGHGGAGLLEISGGRVTDVFGNQHPISASLSSKGTSKRGWAIVATVLGIIVILTPFGIWVDGTPATIQGGQYIDALTTSATEIELPADLKTTEGQ